MYHYEESSIELNPVRLNVSLVFPQQNNAKFKLDIELCGVSYCLIDLTILDTFELNNNFRSIALDY